MAESVVFERPQENALDELKKYLSQIDINITQEQEINNGVGVKLKGFCKNNNVAFIIYFNRSKQQSTKIVIEKSTPEINEKLLPLLQIGAASRSELDKIPINSSMTIADERLFPVIKNALTDAGYLNKELPGQDHIEYILKLSHKSDDLTLTQFKSGTLLIQGSYSDLFDRVVSVIDSIKPLSDEERALLMVPADDREKFLDVLKEKPELSESATQQIQSEAGEYVEFLFENDKKSFITGMMLAEIIETSNKILPEYNFLVAIFAKIFEGFLIKLMIQKDFFSADQYKQNPDIADIGNALRKRKFSKYISDLRRYGYILDELIAIWEGARCKEMHSDPEADQKIVSISSFGDAIDKIGQIKSCMREAYLILIADRYIDNDISRTKVVQTMPQIQLSKTKEFNVAEVNTFTSYIGTDESGKGDYLGPLVIAGVFLNEDMVKNLKSIGVRDSKKISDDKIAEFARTITDTIEKKHYSIVVIGPEKYNELYNKIRNLNTLLAWGHARVIENILANTNCDTAVADQFGNEDFIKNALMEKGKNINLIQMPRAERHVAVAAASILARDSFLGRMKMMSDKYGIKMPKGASNVVIETCETLVKQHGREILSKIAKLHFKTTQAILD
jgi:ribonuclease HIII